MDNTGTTGASNAAGATTFHIPGTVEATSPNTFTAQVGQQGVALSLDGTPADFDMHGARLFALRELNDFTRHLVGGLLTIVEAAIPDAGQAKAIKSLIKREVWEAHYDQAETWARRQAAIEFAALVAYDRRRNADPNSAESGPHPVAPQTWANVVTDREIGANAAWNVFPFSRTGGPAPIDERFPDQR